MPKMSRVKRILVPVDFSKPSLAAFRYATRLAKSRRARIEVLHVVEAVNYAPMIGPSVDLTGVREAQERAAERRLAKLAGDLRRARVRGATTLKIGSAASMIIDRAKKGSADLVVMATQGRGFVQHLLLGSVAERVVRGAPCPVLTLRAGVRASADKWRRIVAATDFSAASGRALDYAIDLCRSSGAELVALHVIEPVALTGDLYGFSASARLYDEIERGAKEALSRIVAGLRRKKRGLRCKAVSVNGMGAMAIVDAAKRLSADVVVVGTHGQSGLERLFLGSVAARVVRTCARPVLTVRSAPA